MVERMLATLERMGDRAGKRGETAAGQVKGPGAARKAQGKPPLESALAETISLALEIVRGQMGCPWGSG